MLGKNNNIVLPRLYQTIIKQDLLVSLKGKINYLVSQIPQLNGQYGSFLI